MHHAVQAGSGCPENCRDILKGTIGLLASVALDDLLRYGIEGKLAADENKSTALDGLGVVPDTGSITGTNDIAHGLSLRRVSVSGFHTQYFSVAGTL
jgi:hypothetical protein